MMMPSIWGENLFDDFMNDFRLPAFPDVDKELYGKHAKNLMKTDVKETEKGYEVDMDLPGFKKEDATVELDKSYLTITAAKGLELNEAESEEAKKEGKYIRKERYSGEYKRSFYVGDDIRQEDIRAKFEDGILKIGVPKKKEQPEMEENKFITIEG